MSYENRNADAELKKAEEIFLVRVTNYGVIRSFYMIKRKLV